jgi:hypothetical protein
MPFDHEGVDLIEEWRARPGARAADRPRAPVSGAASPFTPRAAATPEGMELNPRTLLAREWKGKMERVMILDQGFA